jgi:glycosyltransferase involved in cell wall biosynthesis
VEWWPNAFDEVEFVRGPSLAERPLDLTQIATPRAARQHFWHQFPLDAPDLKSYFGEIWGPQYSATYRDARATFVAHGCDFVSLRVFEAMASGCLVISDRTPAMLKLFNEGEHFIGYDPITGPGGDAIPTTEMIISAVRKINADLPAAQAMADRAYTLVSGRDSFRHRGEQLLQEVKG